MTRHFVLQLFGPVMFSTHIYGSFNGPSSRADARSPCCFESMANSHSFQVKNYTLLHLKSLKVSTGLCTYFVGAEYCLDGLSSLVFYAE